ncbi:MAG: FHA domain-containing protein [Anaerolineae bacterium]|nr:FHA domain-containing protein [Anaerolineae bacterium]
MEYAVITLTYQQQRADLEAPLSVPLFMLAPIVLETMRWADQDLRQENARFVGRLQGSGMIIRPNETLAQAGVVDGDIVELTAVQSNSIDFDRTMNIAPLTGFLAQAYLKSVANGEVFLCRGKSTLVGRSPECAINLSRLPGNDVVSRRHANIVRRDDGYWLTDENSANGTIVDGFVLNPKETVRLRDRCQIQFGEDGPVLVFYAGEAG